MSCYIQSNPGRIITKYQFSELFSKSWLKTIVPANIISGLKHCGVYPFNPRAVLDHDPCNEVPITDKITERSLGDSTGKISQLEEASNSTSIIFSFTPEENDKYNTRFAEGYVAWLKANHPEEDCSNFLPLAEYFPDAVSPDVLSVSDPGSPIPSVSSQCISVMLASRFSPPVDQVPQTQLHHPV